ncbi:MAG: hypothetical protein ACM3U2_00710 [Deltaproteobacteria bacterium]
MIDHELMRALTDAVRELCCRDGALNERLLAAAEKLDLYLPRHERRPGALLQRAQELQDELHDLRDLAPITGAWNATTAQRLSERLLHLYAELQATWCHDAGMEPRPANHSGNLGMGRGGDR